MLPVAYRMKKIIVEFLAQYCDHLERDKEEEESMLHPITTTITTNERQNTNSEDDCFISINSLIFFF